MPATVKCPHCSRPVEWTDGFPFRPFCCERCKLIDLGEWASEGYAIPASPADDEASLDEEGDGSPGTPPLGRTGLH